jgi:hypothetical protein
MSNKISITGKVTGSTPFTDNKGDKYECLTLMVPDMDEDDVSHPFPVVVYAGDWKEEGVAKQWYVTFEGRLDWVDMGNGRQPCITSLYWKEGFSI